VLLEDPTVSGVMNLGPNGVDLRITVKTLNEQHYNIERDLRKLIKETLEANNIEIPYPQIVIHQTKE
jgi:moderate conductance mechanosensitive channel